MCIKKIIKILVTSLNEFFRAMNIERVRAIIEKNPLATHHIIEAVTSINHFTINETIHALKKRKLASRWIPHE